MIMLFIFIALLAVLGYAAMRWGYDSRDGIESSEWQRRATLLSPSHRA